MNDKKRAAPITPAEARAKIARFRESLTNRTHFQIFGADPDTDPERLKAAYHMLARQWHSDAYAGIDLGDAQETLDEIFKLITEAYETITDPKRRAEYVILLDRRAKGLPTDVNEILQGERLFDEAIALMGRRDWQGATERLERAIRFNPDDALMNTNYAWALFNLGQKEQRTAEAAKKAIAILEKAIKRQENLAPAYHYLGQISFVLERPEEAKKWWRRCLEWDPNNVEAARGIRLLATRATKKAAGGGVSGFLGKLFGKK